MPKVAALENLRQEDHSLANLANRLFPQKQTNKPNAVQEKLIRLYLAF